MKISSQLLLNFLLNAVWQIALIAALASLGAWLLRSSSARYRHWLWVGALCLAFLVPAATSFRAVIEATVRAPLTTNTPSPGEEPQQPFPLEVVESRSTGVLASIIQVNAELVFLVLGIYG